jgi:hypothetical protein
VVVYLPFSCAVTSWSIRMLEWLFIGLVRLVENPAGFG